MAKIKSNKPAAKAAAKPVGPSMNPELSVVIPGEQRQLRTPVQDSTGGPAREAGCGAGEVAQPPSFFGFDISKGFS